MGLYEQLGREADRAASLLIEYRKLLVVLSQVQDGQIALDRIGVDLANDSFMIAPPKVSDNGDN